MAAYDAAALQESLYQVLNSNSELNALIGNNKIFDEVPDRLSPPYIVFDQNQVRDWSTFTEAGTLHLLGIDIWSTYRGKKQIYGIAAAIEAALTEFPGQIPDHHVVSIGRQSLATSRLANSGLYRGVFTIRVVTEPIEI